MTTLTALPDGCTVRSPEPGDAEALLEMFVDYNTPLIGFADGTLTEVAERIVEPGFDRMTDGFLVLGGEGRPVGYGTTFGKGDLRIVGIQVWSRTPEVAAWLFDRTMDRALEMGRQGGHGEITVDTDIYRADEAQRVMLAEQGFTTGTTYYRMRIDHAGPVAMPEAPAGVVVRRGAFDDATRWTAHELVITCFSGQYGFVVRPHEEWIEYFDSLSIFDWSQMTLLEVDGRAVALRTCTDAQLETDDCGYIGTLCVLEEFRGRGLATFLLQDAFAHDAAAGRAGTILDVDTNNPTRALGLYESAGMAPTIVSEGWRRVVQVN